MVDSFVMFPMNEDGVFWRPQVVGQTIQDAMSAPFTFNDVFLYSHGWNTVGNSAMITYSQYTVEFARNLIMNGGALPNAPQDSFGFGLHWPSTLSEDEGVIQSAINATTYYQMGARAQHVGASGVYATLSLLFSTRFNANKAAIRAALAGGGVPAPGSLPGSFRLTLLGHSFGCRVVSSAIERLCAEMARPNNNPDVQDLRAFVKNTKINLVLLQAAYKNVELELGGNYADITLANLPNLRMLITTSQLDKALNEWFPIAETMNNIAHVNLHQAVALGGGIGPVVADPRARSTNGGPTAAVLHAYHAPPLVSVAPGFTSAMVPPGQSMVVADLTPIHLYHLNLPPNAQWSFAWEDGGGSHDDISCPEIYNLINGFCFA